LVFDTALLAKYGGNGPRYTSYPTADRFVEAFDGAAYRHWLSRRSVGGAGRSLGLYVHVPFCDTLCFYCACNKIATRDAAKARKYTSYLLREIDLVAGALDGERRVSKMHWGGGTNTRSRSIRAAPGPIASNSSGAWASTASRSACRTSTPRCRRR
jgi:oxygen-independent coproporphyrinogen-3 oxidase